MAAGGADGGGGGGARRGAAPAGVPDTAMTPSPVMGEVAAAQGAGFAEDLSGFSLRRCGPEDWLGLALLWAAGILVFAQFFTRYAMNSSLAWTEEAARYALMALTFVGMAGAVRRGGHIRVEALEDALRGPARAALRAFLDAARLAFWAFGAVVSYDLADRMGVMPMDSLDASLAWVYWPIFLGFCAAFLREVGWVRRRWRAGGDPPGAEQGMVG